MHWKNSIVAALILSVGAATAKEPSPVPDGKLVSFADSKVKKVQPTRSERRIDEIGWAPSLTAAKLFAATEKRPVFLFTHDGKMETGRC